MEKVTERVSRAGHTAGSVAVVAAVDLRSSPGDTPPSVSSFPALVLHVKGGEMERDEELAICAGLDACNALDDSVIFASIAEKVAAYSARIGTNVTIPSLAECEHAVAVAEVLLAEEDEKKPIPANGTRAICSDSTNCGDCRLAGCGWCRIAQLCVVDLPNGCNGQRDHIGVNGFSESCDDTECNSMDCCVQIDQKCGMIEANFGAEVCLRRSLANGWFQTAFKFPDRTFFARGTFRRVLSLLLRFGAITATRHCPRLYQVNSLVCCAILCASETV